MSWLFKALCSTVGKKYIMALTGLSLVGFVITHFLANLLLYLPSGDKYNAYSHGLFSWGALIYIAEAGLALLFLIHIVTAVQLKLKNKKARPEKYKHSMKTKHIETANTSSKTMVVTGIILALFLVLHVKTFRFGPGIEQGYVTTLQGETARDLTRLVVEEFQNPLYVIIYCFVMIVFGIHIRHGIWSAFQSLGFLNEKYSGPLHKLSLVIAIVMSAGFFFIPIWLYIR